MGVSDLISLAQEITCQMHLQNYHAGNILLRKLLGELEANHKEMLVDNSYLNSIMCMLLQTLEKDDMVLCADFLEDGLVPCLKELLVPVEEIASADYILEKGSCGYYTLKHISAGIYLHSNSNPVKEAKELVGLCYNPEYEEYAVWGLGLGYHVAELYKIARGAIKIRVFDEDENVIQLAKQFGVLGETLQENVKLIHDSNGKKFASAIVGGGKGILMHLPSIKKCANKELKEILQHFFAKWNGTIQLKTELAVNFRSNVAECEHNVDELEDLVRDKDVIIVAGGPSVDSRLEYLKQNSGNKIIFAATTVLRKLVEENIYPDFAVVMDSNQRTYGHMSGIEDVKIPLIADSTAYWEFVAKHKGTKYIAYQKGYGDSELRALKEKRRTYETGGSVTTLMLDIVLQLGAKTVTFVGADFAFPGGVTHAKDTMDRSVRNTSHLEKTISVTGDEVYTDSLMTAYRKWIERKIEEYPKVEFYNMSDCGAEIKGTKVVTP